MSSSKQKSSPRELHIIGTKTTNSGTKPRTPSPTKRKTVSTIGQTSPTASKRTTKELINDPDFLNKVADSYIQENVLDPTFLEGMERICGMVNEGIEDDTPRLDIHRTEKPSTSKTVFTIDDLGKISRQDPKFEEKVLSIYGHLFPKSRVPTMIQKAITQGYICKTNINASISALLDVTSHKTESVSNAIAKSILIASEEQFKDSGYKLMNEVPEQIGNVLRTYKDSYTQLRESVSSIESMISSFQAQCNNTTTTMNDITTKMRELVHKPAVGQISIDPSKYQHQPIEIRTVPNPINIPPNEIKKKILKINGISVLIKSNDLGNVEFCPPGNNRSIFEPYMNEIIPLKMRKYECLRFPQNDNFEEFLSLNNY